MLENLVVSAESTASSDGGGRAGVLLLDGEGILAHGRPPDVSQSAFTKAVDALGLVWTCTSALACYQIVL